jgi:V/A-type H+/Na+-transporting ATPase subunit E
LSTVSKGLSGIAKEILEDAAREAESIILKAETQGEKILEDAVKEAEKKYRNIIDKTENSVEAERKAKITLLEIEIRNKLLKVQDELVNEAFEKAQAKLKEYTTTEAYKDCLTKLVLEAAKDLGAEKAVIQLNQHDYDLLTEEKLKELSKKIKVHLVKLDKPIITIGGVIVKSSDDQIIVNNTFENRLIMFKANLRVKIANTLFKEESKSQAED